MGDIETQQFLIRISAYRLISSASLDIVGAIIILKLYAIVEISKYFLMIWLIFLVMNKLLL